MKYFLQKLSLPAALAAVCICFAADQTQCSRCGGPLIGSYIQLGDQQLCSKKCYHESRPRCDVCGSRVRSRYFQSGDKVYCSDECYSRSLPVCNTCNRRLRGEHLTLDGKGYCRRACLEAAMPKCDRCSAPLYDAVLFNEHQYCSQCAKKPKCWRCHLPDEIDKVFSDGRHICKNCSPDMITNAADAKSLFLIARHQVYRVTDYKSPTIPVLKVVGRDELRRWAPEGTDVNAVQWGVYRRDVTVATTWRRFKKQKKEVTDVSEEIRILTGLARTQFIVTACHELTHDLLSELYPQLDDKAPVWVEEGICQYVAAAVCLLNGYYDDLEMIEKAPDRRYGDGYRFFKNKFGDAHWNDLTRWLKTTDLSKLPDNPPGS